MPRKVSGGKLTQRKRRLPRLPIAPYVEVHPEFAPSGEEWARIQDSFQIELDEKQRSEIATIVENYFVVCNIEKNAPFQVDELKWLNRFCKILNQLVEFTTVRPTDAKVDAGEWATVEIVNQLAKLRPTPIMRWDKIRRFVLDLRLACERAKATIEIEAAEDRGFVEGAGWELMINDFIDFAADRGVSTSVSKGQRGSDNGPHSQIVEFVWKLQQLFPMEYRRHNQSKQALAGAISKIKRARKSVGP